EADVDVFASSHTCLPALRRFKLRRGKEGIIANNGASGMPNFHGLQSGLLTRISTHPSPHASLYGTKLDQIHVDALPIQYGQPLWLRNFLANWPVGSDAHTSYFARIANGPEYTVQQALHRFHGQSFCGQ